MRAFLIPCALGALLAAATDAATAQDPAGAGAAPAEDPAITAATAAFSEGSAAFQARNWAAARAHYERALALSSDAFPQNPERRNAWQAGAHRAVAWTYAREGNSERCHRSAKQAWVQLLAAGGDSREEDMVQQATYDCLAQLPTTHAKLAFLTDWRTALTQLLPNPIPPKDDTLRRLRWQIGQAWHDQADIEQAGGLLEAAAETLRRAIAFRHDARDTLGTAWSCQNRFWLLLRLDKDGEAGAQAAHTIGLIRRGAGLEVECRLAANLESWADQQDQAGDPARAAALLAAMRESGACEGTGLATLTSARLLDIELELVRRAPDPDSPTARDRRRLLATELIARGTLERHPAPTFAGAMELARLALHPTAGSGADAESYARTAIVAAESLGDRHRADRAALRLAQAQTRAGDVDAAEATVRAVFTRHGRPGSDPWIRERARRLGAELAAVTENAELTGFYAFSVKPPPQHPVEGHTWVGADARAFWRGVAALDGDGAILTITRNGNHLILRSPLAVGTQAIEWEWRLRYVNANGLVLAIRGPDVAVVGRRAELGAPAAPGGVVRVVDDGLDVDALGRPGLPLLAPRVTLRDGETAFVNRFLRVYR